MRSKRYTSLSYAAIYLVGTIMWEEDIWIDFEWYELAWYTQPSSFFLFLETSAIISEREETANCLGTLSIMFN